VEQLRNGSWLGNMLRSNNDNNIATQSTILDVTEQRRKRLDHEQVEE